MHAIKFLGIFMLFLHYFQNSRNILQIEMVNDNKSNQNKKEYKKEKIETLT